MTLPVIGTREGALRLPLHGSFYDSHSQCRVYVGTPEGSPADWARNLAGAYESYEAYGVLKALEYDVIADGASTSLFYVAVNSAGDVVGGVRAQGPYVHADEAHAIAEWDGCEGQDLVRRMIDDRISAGVVELKNGWVSPHAKRKNQIADVIARCIIHTTAIFDVQYALGTGATHVLALWARSGGLAVDSIPPAAYPSDRYRTKLVWWNRHTFTDDANQQQVFKALSEWMELADSAGLPVNGIELQARR